jgi:FkbM family methyltransferase
MSLTTNRYLRKIGLPVLRFFGRDITMKHPYTADPMRLHSFKHKGYWFRGARREQATMELFRRLVQPGDTVLEAGGHIGFIAVLFGSLAREVHVFEPDPQNLAYLTENTQRFPNIHVHAKGLSDSEGVLEFYSESLTGQNSSFVNEFNVLHHNATISSVDPKVKRISVPITSIDSFVESQQLKIDFIKIDVEGYEQTVLRGAERTLRKQHPSLIIEVNRGTAPGAIKLLKEYGYIPRRIAEPNLPLVADDDDRTQNLLCLKNDDCSALQCR